MRAGMLLLLALRRAAAAEPCALCMAAHPNHPFKWGRCMPPRDQCSPPKGVELLVVRGTGNKWFAEDFLDQLRYFAHGSRHLDGACPQSSTWRWTEARTTVFVGPGTRAPPGLFTLPITGRERASYVAILRHPVLRVVSRSRAPGSTRLCGIARSAHGPVWKSNFGRPAPSTRCRPLTASLDGVEILRHRRDVVPAWGQLDGVEVHEGRARWVQAWVNRTRFPNRQSPGHLWNVPDNLY